MTDRISLNDMTSDQLDQLYNDLDRLRAGEEPGWDPLTEPTPGQWIARWNQATPEERLYVAERAMANGAATERCVFMAHEKRLAEDRKAWVTLARIRDVIADMEEITGARHWARILRKVVDGEEPAPAAATQPREHCGDLKPQFSGSRERTECVLRPGHQGSHADQHGTRWWWTDEQHQEQPDA